jgi:hypothetical protein
MVDVAMATWGKDAGGRVVAAHLVFVCFVWEPETPGKILPTSK